MPPPSLAVACEDPRHHEPALALAAHLGVEIVKASDDEHDYLLVFTPTHLELRPQAPEASGPIYVDFAAGRTRHRRLYGGGRGQPLARAVGLKGGATPSVTDATAGLGRDAFVLATLGCDVTLIERSPVIAALLSDAIARAGEDTEIGSLVAKRLRLIEADAIGYLAGLPQDRRPDVVYLDPMYPHRTKSALVKKEMRIFRDLVGEDVDSGDLLSAALGAARRRVVVKRPRPAPALPGPNPTMAISGKNTRFDVYVVDVVRAAATGDPIHQ